MRNRIAFVRNALGISAESLASQLGISPATLAAWESGSRSPSLEQVVQLSNILCLPVEFLFCVGKLSHIDGLDP